MKAVKLLLNIVYPLLLLLLVALALLSVYQKELIIAGIYLAGIILALLLPRFLIPAQPKNEARLIKKHQKHEGASGKNAGFFSRLFSKKAGKKSHKMTSGKNAGLFSKLFSKKAEKKSHEGNSGKNTGFFSKLFGNKNKKIREDHTKKKKAAQKKLGFFGRLFLRKHLKTEQTKEDIPAGEKGEYGAQKKEEPGFIKRLFKTKKVLKVYQGKEEKEPEFVEDRGEKKLELVEINKPVERKGTSKHRVMTDFDKLVDWINQKGVVSLTEVAKHFNLPNDKIESWAKLLEEHGLLIIEYPTFGEIRLRAVKKHD